MRSPVPITWRSSLLLPSGLSFAIAPGLALVEVEEMKARIDCAFSVNCAVASSSVFSGYGLQERQRTQGTQSAVATVGPHVGRKTCRYPSHELVVPTKNATP